MTTNKPEIKIYEPSEKDVTAMRKASFRNTGPDRYVRLSDYEALRKDAEVSAADANAAEQELDAVRVECDKLRKTNSELSSLAYNLTLDLNQLREDAERYRKLRSTTWYASPLCVVVDPKHSVQLGSDCPSHKRLDDIVDNLHVQLHKTSASPPPVG